MNHVNEGSVLPVHPLIFFVYFDFSSPPFVVAFIFWNIRSLKRTFIQLNMECKETLFGLEIGIKEDCMIYKTINKTIEHKGLIDKTFILELHDKLDEVNSNYGNELELCLFCHSNKINHKGIIHSENCIVKRLRYLIS
jgi:hypothetical protein